MPLWEGRFGKELDAKTNDFNSSIHFDSRLFRQDIAGSIAHSKMLAKQGIIAKEDADKIVEELAKILEELENGRLMVDKQAEDIHMFIESELTGRLGDTGKKLHTARSRNDQVALDMRMYLKAEIEEIVALLKQLMHTFLEKAADNLETVMPGYTHLQRAQPITLAHHLMAYCEMFLRDQERLQETYRRTNVMPLGSCALAGTTYDLDRDYVKELLHFDAVTQNSLDGVADRDFVLDLGYSIAVLMMHLSRFSEEVILWCSWEFRFLELDDGFATGSSIMPQKKNPDIAELIRGKTGRVFGDLMGTLTVLKGLPLAYNKDMQEDKEAIFDSIDHVKMCLETLEGMVKTAKVCKENMKKAALKGFINATDCADYLVKKGLPFRQAYKVTGGMVKFCIEQDKDLESLTLAEYQQFDDHFGEDIYEAIDLVNCVKGRNVVGGPAPEQVKKRMEEVKMELEVCLFPHPIDTLPKQ